MVSYSWKSAVNGDWTVAADWNAGTVPNDVAADVTIDAPTTVPGGYLVTIAAGESETINSLSMNGVNNILGVNTTAYTAAALELDGTIAFAPGSAGMLGGSLQTIVHTDYGKSAEIINGGTLDGFIQVQGSLLITGTNGVYITNYLQALAGTVTIDTKSIAEMTGNTLFDGIFDSKGPGASVSLGGPLQNLIVNIATIEGPPLIPDGWTELLFNDPTAVIQEWNGTGYVSVETTLQEIGARGTVDVLAGRNYTTANALTVELGGLLNLEAGTVTAAAININAGGVVQGHATLAESVVNNGTLRASGGTMHVTGGLTGTGVVMFDTQGVVPTVGATAELNAVSAGQTIMMNGYDTLKLDTPASFAGTISAKVGDKIVLQGVTATSAALDGNTLVVSNGTTTVASLTLSGSYTGDSFTVSGSTITVGTAVPTPAPTPTPTPVPTPTPTPTPPANFILLDTTTNVSSTTAGDVYSGPVPYLQWQMIAITQDNLNITATVPNAFLRGGPGMDGLDVSQSNGNNILDGSTGSNFLIGGTGKDAFYLDDRDPTSPIFSTIVNFHAGDDVAVWGVDNASFSITILDNQGAAGYTGVDMIFSKPGQFDTSFVLAGYTSADLTNGRLSLSYGKTGDLPGLPGSQYLNIHAN